MNGDTRFPAFLKTLAPALAALAAIAALHPALRRAAAYRPAFAMTDQVREEINTSAFATILGEARASMADLMWVKTERYLHRGVAFQPHLDESAMARTGQVVAKSEPATAEAHEDDHAASDRGDGHEHGPECEHGQGQLVALVPAAEHDWRGFVGTLQRQIQPWRSPDAPDEHTPGDELVPWYRMLTYSDPQHWRGYLIGTWWLSKIENDPAALAEAEAFVTEGMRNNPEVFQLPVMAGRLRMKQERWREAIEVFERAVALALKVRPVDGAMNELWTESDEEDFALAMRYIPLLEWRRLNDAAAARKSLARARKLLPNDGPLRELDQQMAAAAH